jgi:hypothetical protein
MAQLTVNRTTVPVGTEKLRLGNVTAMLAALFERPLATIEALLDTVPAVARGLGDKEAEQ